MINFKKLRDSLARLGSPFLIRTRQDIADIAALQRISRCFASPSYIPWTSYALRPSAVECLLNEAVINKRSHAVELGGGISSLYLASVLGRQGGRVTIIDHDQNWLSIIESMMKSTSIAPTAYQTVHAPLKEQTFGGKTYSYFDAEAIISALTGSKIDMVLVDGPPAKPGSMTRYPAMEILLPHLADDFTIFLDDIFRRDELLIAQEWAKEFHLRLNMPERIGGLAVFSPKRSRRDYVIA